MDNFDIELSLKQAAIAYFGNDHSLGGYLLKGCVRRLSLLPLNKEQVTYLNQAIATLNEMANNGDFTGLADVIHFELMQNFPDFDSLLAQETQDPVES